MEIKKTSPEAIKKEKYLELFHGEPDAIFVFSGDIVEMNDKIDDFGRKAYGEIASISGDLPQWRESAFSDLDPHGGISGGIFRVHAAAKAARIFPESRIVTTTRDRDVDLHLKRPAHADVMAEEMKRRGIAESRIILERESVNTNTEIREMLILAAKNNWGKVAAITSNYHVPRTRAMLEAMMNFRKEDLLGVKKDPELLQAIMKIVNAEIIIISDEDILVGGEGGAWWHVFEKMKQTKEYEIREKMEAKGLDDLKKGTYGHKK